MLERRTPRRGTAWLLFLAGMMLFAALWTIQVREALDANELTNIIFGLGATFMILGLAALEHGAGLVVSPALVFVGEASYSIYLVHYPVISIATKAIMAVRDRMPAPDWLLYLCVAASALGLGILFHVCVERQILARLRTNPSVRTLSPALPHSPAGRAHSYSAGRGAR
jgi:peptidoglycan/LPS O-acetylase OafA/YrhL